MTRAARAIALLAALLASLAACGGDDEDGPADPDASGDPGEPAAPVDTGDPDQDGDDWSLPAGAAASDNSGFFSEIADPARDVAVHVIDVSWRQFEPNPGEYRTDGALAAIPPYYDGLDFSSLDDQRAAGGRYWLRFWVSDVRLTPTWLADECPGLAPIDGVGYEGDRHYPLWDDCVWEHAREAYRQLLVEAGVRDDPDLVLVYVPGSFTYCEFDFDLVEASGVDFATFDDWFHRAIADLVEIAGDASDKLVYTGEDYPFSGFETADDLFARDAVAAGTGIRTGISELFDFHLSQVPAYGTTVADDGHMVTDETWDAFLPGRIRATEHECYIDCGFLAEDPYYAVKQSNLKALQLRLNWIYVVPQEEEGRDDGPSFLDSYPELWTWVRLSLDKTPADSPDAWVALREAEDLYWVDDDSWDWSTRPWVINLERWIVQRDVAPDGESRPAGDEVADAIGGDGAGLNGTAHEGRATTAARGGRYLYFDVDRRFLEGDTGPIAIKVTFRDGGAPWALEYRATGGQLARTQTVESDGSGSWRTVTFEIDDARFDDELPGETDLRIDAGGDEDVEVRFVRIVKL